MPRTQRQESAWRTMAPSSPSLTPFFTVTTSVVLLVATVRASERTGDLQEALKRYADYVQRIDALRRKVVSASIYPALLATTGVLVLGFLMLYVVPRFSLIYEEIGICAGRPLAAPHAR